MIYNKTFLLVSSVFLLGACSTVSDMFVDADAKPPLEGERISVLELQKSLSPDASTGEGKQNIAVPQSWDNTSWPQAGGYPNHSMQNLSLSDNDTLERVWSSDIGRGSTGDLPLTAQPIIAGGVVYTLDTNARLSAFSAKNGKRLWRTNVTNKDEDEDVVSGGVSFAHDMLYVTNGYDEVLAVSPEDGAIVWRKRLPAPSRAAPTVLGGRVFVATIDSRLVAFSAKDGLSLWEYTGISEATGLLGAASAAANSDIVVPVFSSGEITALRVENGSVAWSDNLSHVKRYGGGLESLADIKAMPVLDRGLIVAISFSGKIAAIDERTGARVWQREISGAQTPWIAGNTVYVLSSDNQLISLDLATGSIYWVEELPSFEDEKDKEDPIYWSGPVMGDGSLFVASSHGYLYVFDSSNGALSKRLKIKSDVQIPPVIANGVLYLLSEDGRLMAYR